MYIGVEAYSQRVTCSVTAGKVTSAAGYGLFLEPFDDTVIIDRESALSMSQIWHDKFGQGVSFNPREASETSIRLNMLLGPFEFSVRMLGSTYPIQRKTSVQGWSPTIASTRPPHNTVVRYWNYIGTKIKTS